MHPTLKAIFPNGIEELRHYFSAPSNHADTDARIWSGRPRQDKDWLAEYEAVSDGTRFLHSEPWLTLVALYGLFGDQSQCNNPNRLSAVNSLFAAVYAGKNAGCTPPVFSSIVGVHSEVCLRENLGYRRYLRTKVFSREEPYHPYSDRHDILKAKLSREAASLEGNTHLDALISGLDAHSRPIHVFIEAKFLSDISKDISYVPVRNQLARNMDCAMDLMTEGASKPNGLKDFWFILLTPGMFRTDGYGGPSCTRFDCLMPQRSRLYCYKMDDYLDPDMLRQDLPHWSDLLSRNQWQQVSSRIGWMTFEGILGEICQRRLQNRETLRSITRFFAERQIVSSR